MSQVLHEWRGELKQGHTWKTIARNGCRRACAPNHQRALPLFSNQPGPHHLAPPVGSEVAPLGEHTDFSGITVPFNQLGSLQMLNSNYRKWEHVNPQPGCAIIILGDTIVKLITNGLYSGVHSVVGLLGGPSTQSTALSISRVRMAMRSWGRCFDLAIVRKMTMTADE